MVLDDAAGISLFETSTEMRNALLNIGLYGCLLTVILLIPARAIAQPGEITWETLPEVISRNWKQGQHKIFAATQRGLAKQKHKLPTRLMSVQLGGQAQLPITAQAKGVEQHQVSVGAVVGLNQLPQTVKRLFAIQAKKARAAEFDARHHYALQLIEAYGSWWVASSLEGHIAEDIKQARQELMPLKKAFEAGQLSELQWLDLSLELANLQREHTQLRQQKQQANVYLKQLLNGEGWRLKLGKRAQASTKPWAQLEQQIKQHPALQYLEMQQQELRARATVERKTNPPTLSVDLGWLWGPQRVHMATVQAMFVWPLSNPGLVEAERLQAQSIAKTRAHRLLKRQLLRQIQAEQKRIKIWGEAINALDAGAFKLLNKRQALLEAGLKSKQISLIRVLRGRRAIHEAKHQRAQLQFQQLRSVLTAQILLKTWKKP